MPRSRKLAALIPGLYVKHAARWIAQRKNRGLERSWLDRFCKVLPERANILDLGCGSGEPIASTLIGRGHKLTGIDTSPRLIDHCARRFPDQTWLVGDMREMHIDDRFDAVIAWHSFFHLTVEDQRSIFSQFARWVKPDGALMFTSGHEAGEAVGTLFGDDLYHASLSQKDYKALLTDHGFRLENHIVRDPACGDATVWLALKN